MSIASDPLSLLFIGCFLFGLLFLLATAFLGHLGGHGHGIHGVGHGHGPHVHAHTVHGAAQSHAGATQHVHASHGNMLRGATHANGVGAAFAAIFAYVNPFSLVLFLLGFGFFGYVFHAAIPLALPFVLILAGISGFIIAGLLLAMLQRVFGNSEGATVQDVSDRTGLLGKVSTTIGENSLGEIIYVSPGGMRKSIPARSVDGRRLEREEEVVVVSYQHGVAEVDTWDHFVQQEEQSSADVADADDLATLRVLLEEPLKTDAAYVIRKDFQKE